MSLYSSDGKAALLVQGAWPSPVTLPLLASADQRNALWVQSEELSARIEGEFPEVQVLGACTLAPLLLLRCDEEQCAGILEELSRWPQIERAEETLPEEEGALLQPVKIPVLEEAKACIAGFAELGNPLLVELVSNKGWERLRDALRRAPGSDGPESSHADSVLAAFLETLGPERTPRCIFESLGRGAGPFAWLAAIDRLLCRGASVINLSYGRLPIERELGWNGLEWGTQLLCQGSGRTIVAAAGRVNEGLSLGDALYLPASVPQVLAAADELRVQATGSEREATKVLLASQCNPLEGRWGSSFSAPRISGLAVRAYDDLPREARKHESVLSLLLASARPSGTSSPGFPDSKRLSQMIAREDYRRGRNEERAVLPITSGLPLRLALSWRDSDLDPDLSVSADRDQSLLRRTGQWMVMDYLPTSSRIELRGLSGPWSLAWHPLSPEEFAISKDGLGSVGKEA